MSSGAPLASVSSDPALPAVFAGAPLQPSENVLGSLEVDLNRRLHFGSGQLLITNQRLISRFPDETAWQSWALRPGLTMAHHDHAGVGTLELRDPTGRLAQWRYTLGCNAAALKLLDQFEQAMAALAGAAPRMLRRTPNRGKRPSRLPTTDLPPPGHCCVCGVLPGRISGRCWPDSC